LLEDARAGVFDVVAPEALACGASKQADERPHGPKDLICQSQRMRRLVRPQPTKNHPSPAFAIAGVISISSPACLLDELTSR